jgi:hypothetical protein
LRVDVQAAEDGAFGEGVEDRAESYGEHRCWAFAS